MTAAATSTSVAPTSSTPPRRLARADRERQILEIAHREFAERGYGATTMEGIAVQAGVTKPLLYAYFGNKDRLYEACMQPAGEALAQAVLAALEGAEDANDALERGVRAFFNYVDGDRDAWRVLFDETLPAGGPIAERANEYRGRITALLGGSLGATLPRELQQQPQHGVAIEALSISLMAAAEALARWWLRTEALTPQQAASLLIATVEPGLRKVTGTRPTTKDQKTK